MILYFTFFNFLFSVFITPGMSSEAKVTSAQLQDLVAELWYADFNRATDVQVDVNYQGHTDSKTRMDQAKEKLFRKVDPQVLSRPTVETLIDLFESYKADAGRDDVTTPERQRKIDKFLDEILKTEIMQILRKSLNRYGYRPASDSGQFRQQLLNMWFHDYSRHRGVQGSSGFEHVFVGETKNGEVSGLHNWIRIFWLEKNGQVDYTGFIIKRKHISMIQFKWGDYWKPSASMFIGTSPEFDFAIYTLCFLAKPGRDACNFLLGDCTDVKVTSFSLGQQNDQRTLIGSVFPFPGKTLDQCQVSSRRPTTADPPKISDKESRDDNKKSNDSSCLVQNSILCCVFVTIFGFLFYAKLF